MSRVAEHFFDRPWYLTPGKLQDIGAFLQARESGLTINIDSESISVDAIKDSRSAATPSYAVQDGIAVIPIQGIIEQKMNLIMRFSGGTSTELLKRDINAALADPSVKGIIFDVNSPGGSVNGTQEVSDTIYQARGKKPMWAIANEQMASAAYFIGSAADKVIVTETSDIGSIGVIASILDRTAANEKRGYAIYVVKAGALKDTTSPDTKMTPEGLAYIQDVVNSYYDLFVNAVSRNRSLDRAATLELASGRVWIGAKTVQLGLADSVMTFDQAIQAMQETFRPKTTFGLPV